MLHPREKLASLVEPRDAQPQSAAT
jgi:hypothetical protein